MLDMNIRQGVDSGLYSYNDSVEEEVCLRVSKDWRFAARQIEAAKWAAPLNAHSSPPQNLQKAALWSCPSAAQTGQARLSTGWRKALDISTVTIPVGTAMIA